MNIPKTTLALIFVLITAPCIGQTTQNAETTTYPKAKVSYDDFKELVAEVESIRSQRMISLNQFLELQRDTNTIVLDTRSRDKYLSKHLQGAINLPFTEFTQSTLRRLIPDTTTTILIYCNNNFSGDDVFFPTKNVLPEGGGNRRFLAERKPISLALNVPTYINLYGYGYRNIYELDELVDIKDPRVEFEGASLLKGLIPVGRN
ncbi:rhodanese-like domain-containing protein [Lewinella cohaerens]|uniref:rhodanese-like domain-containing protein n=1 Tax=Lewinella cohaerens TaxID=70995 RepID=UPI00035C14BD|nr:rhodanese-like domain-containing protein [Lewinella cohaerens]